MQVLDLLSMISISYFFSFTCWRGILIIIVISVVKVMSSNHVMRTAAMVSSSLLQMKLLNRRPSAIANLVTCTHLRKLLSL